MYEDDVIRNALDTITACMVKVRHDYYETDDLTAVWEGLETVASAAEEAVNAALILQRELSEGE